MAVGGALGSPDGVRRAVHVLNEIGQVLRRLIDIQIGNGQETRGFAEIQKVRNSPTV